MKKSALIGCLTLAGGIALGAGLVPKDNPFYIYKDQGSQQNHFTPSGWMGDYGDLKMNQSYPRSGPVKSGARNYQAPAPTLAAIGGDATGMSTSTIKVAADTCMQFTYSAERKQGAGWTGVYWQHPANNWGDKKGGYDLSAFSKLRFEARGDKGGEVIDKFMMGGITGQGEEGDSDNVELTQVTLTKDWKTYEIDLTGHNLNHVIGGFGFAANADKNPQGLVMYIDNVRYE